MALKEEYRSDRDDIVTEFFFPCLSNCVEYNRCVDFLSIHTLTTISMAFENFSEGKAKLRMITGHRFRTSDLNLFTKMFSEKNTNSFKGNLIKDSKIQKLQKVVDEGTDRIENCNSKFRTSCRFILRKNWNIQRRI